MHNSQYAIEEVERKRMIGIMVDFMKDIHSETSKKQTQEMRDISQKAKVALDTLNDVGVMNTYDEMINVIISLLFR